MNLLERMKTRAKSKPKTLVLPEGTDLRTLQAARRIVDDELAASVTIIGKEADVIKLAAPAGVNLSGINILDPAASSNLGKYAKEYYELRKYKGMSSDEAKTGILVSLRWGAMMVRLGDADAVVAGVANAPADVLRAGLTIIGMAGDMKTASSFYIVETDDTSYGTNGTFLFSDGAVVPEPTAEQLADIAIACAQSCQNFMEAKPYVALLSFSTKGSGGNHPSILKIKETLEILEAREPDLTVDGEIQADAAIIPAIADKKAPGSPIRGKTNILVFPDINAANIGVKLAQHFGKLDVYGPFLQGFSKPICNLSRAATVEEIVNTCALTLALVK